MAKISTRPAEREDDSVILKLQAILEEGTSGVVSAKSTATFAAGSDVETLTNNIRHVIRFLNNVAGQLYHDVGIATRDNMILTVRLNEALTALETIMDVGYDEALDHATADLMDAFCGSGSAEVTDDGLLSFDQRITFSKTDLKPILREAILKYIEAKLN